MVFWFVGVFFIGYFVGHLNQPKEEGYFQCDECLRIYNDREKWQECCETLN